MINLNQFKDEYLLGLIDGLNGSNITVLTLVLFPTENSASIIARLVIMQVISRAVTSSISMGRSVYKADDSSSNKTSLMGGVSTCLGYFTTAVSPIIGFFFGEQVGIIMFIPIVITMLIIISKIDIKKIGFKKNLISTFIWYAIAVGAGILATFLVK